MTIDTSEFEVDASSIDTDHGVITPNGKITWLGDLFHGPFQQIVPAAIETEEGRGLVLDVWRRHIDALGIAYNAEEHRLRFVVRNRATAFTGPRPVEAVQR